MGRPWKAANLKGD